MEKNIRKLAIEAVQEIDNYNKFSTDIINSKLKDISDEREAAFFRELVYGVIENIKYIDYIINQSSKIKTKKMQHYILQNMRIGVYQICFLRTPAYAAINEAVKMVKKKKGYKSGNFVNGVLRNIDRNREKYMKIKADNLIEYLSIRYSYSKDLLEYLAAEYEEDFLKSLLSSMNDRPPLSIRVNTNNKSLKEVEAILNGYGFKTIKSSLTDNSLIIENPINITKLKEFRQGDFTIQDQSSILVSEQLNPQQGSKILDLCAAPGSKTSHLAQLTNNKSTIYANDISSKKLHLIEENMNRMNFDNYKILNFDAAIYQEELKEKFDYILVDAPCSGLGIVRRKPDIKLNKGMKDIRELSSIQEKILDNAYKYLKKGGELVYSTCTYGSIENDNQIKKISEKYSDFKIKSLGENEQFIKVYTNETGADGFFIAKLYKED